MKEQKLTKKLSEKKETPLFSGEVRDSLNKKLYGKFRNLFLRSQETSSLNSIKEIITRPRLSKKVLLIKKGNSLWGLAVIIPAHGDFNNQLRGVELGCERFVNGHTWEIRTWGKVELLNVFSRVRRNKQIDASSAGVRKAFMDLNMKIGRTGRIERVLADRNTPKEEFNFPFLNLLACKKVDDNECHGRVTDYGNYRIVTF
ncbi:MAG: hypothetical protein V5A57_01960 [Candidatus Paceibacterota bacterium]